MLPPTLVALGCVLGVAAHQLPYYVHEGTHVPGKQPLPSLNSTDGAGMWEWHDVEGTQCMDKRQSGFWFRQGDNDKLMVYLMGGGACFNGASCLQATKNPKGIEPPPTTGIFNTDSEFNNPVGNHSMVFIPYCTGDVFMGDQDQEQSFGLLAPAKRIFKGRDQVNRVFQSLTDSTYLSSSLEHFILTGESAGGFGSLANYYFVRTNFVSDLDKNLNTHFTLDTQNGARSLLIDDSGIVMNKFHLTPCLTKYWYRLFNFKSTVPVECTSCQSSLYNIYDLLQKEYPNDVMAFISSNMDSVIDLFYSFGFQKENNDGECGNGLLPPSNVPVTFKEGIEDFFYKYVIGDGINTNNFASYFFPGTKHTHTHEDTFYFETVTFNDLNGGTAVKLVEWYRQIVNGVPLDVEHNLFETSHLTRNKN